MERSRSISSGRDEKEYVAFCGYHVRSVALSYGVFGFCLSAMAIYFAANKNSAPEIVVNAIQLVAFSGILVADRCEKSGGYIVFLVINGMALFLGLLATIGLLVLAALGEKELLQQYLHLKPSIENDRFSSLGSLVAVILVGFVFELIGVYCWHVVYRAWKYMRELNSSHEFCEKMIDAVI